MSRRCRQPKGTPWTLTEPTASARDARRASQANGAEWEGHIEHHNKNYESAGQAYVIKRGAPTTILGTIGRGIVKARILGTGPSDYGGVLAGGRAVDFEAKSSIDERWPLSKLKPHQAKHLDLADGCRGVTFVALRTTSGEWVLPWRALAPLWHEWSRSSARAKWDRTHTVRRGSASLSAEDCDLVGLRMEAPGHWLPAVGRLFLGVS